MNGKTQEFRLRSGGLVDRSQRLEFKFDGQDFSGHPGDTLASALLANGIRLVGRSFKYHRPRGIWSAGPEEPNALVELGKGARCEPNTKVTTTELFDGLEAKSQNRWPSLRFDVMAVNQLFAPFIVAGFYYKTFKWPAKFWEAIYEPLIRRAAGLGSAAGVADPDHYEKAWAHCDVLIAGAGPAGIASALAAGRAGARVILAEEDFVMGGRLLADNEEINGDSASNWLASAMAELQAMENVQLMLRTAVIGAFDGGTYGLIERVNDHMPIPPPFQARQRFWRVVAKRSIVATGAIERPVTFANNDRPGVMAASAVRTYLRRFGVKPGKRIAVFTNNSDGWQTVDALENAGVRVAAVIDAREQITAEEQARAKFGGFEVLMGHVASVTGGPSGLTTVRAAARSGRNSDISADCLAVSGGWNPAVGLTCHRRGKPVWNAEIAAFVPGICPPGMSVAGAANGAFSLTQCLEEGHKAGKNAAGETGHRRNAGNAAAATPEDRYSIKPLWHVKGKGKAFVDLQNDVTVSDIELADREGFRSVEHLKRYTTLGMATDQGKTSNVTGLAILAGLAGGSIAETGTTIYRPPSVPVAIGAFAGHHRDRNFQPTRLTPSHNWALRNGASFVDTGLWKRAEWYRQPGENVWLESVTREVRNVRNNVGFCDVSTLGKIDIFGPDAGKFLDRVYINTFSTLDVGKARYGLMLREDGFILDDGTTSRLAEDHFFMTTTTANAARIMQHLDYCRQVLWPELDVQIASATEAWAQFSIAGPATRLVLNKLVESGEDLSNASHPFMAVREVALRGKIKARLFRISFSGELAFEIAVPRRYGESLAQNMMEMGEAHGIQPYGTEALNVMRIEKGHVSGAELNGTTTAEDLGLGRMMSSKKDYIGRVLARREALIATDRQVLVGIKPLDKKIRIDAGAHILAKSSGAQADQGYVTSVCFSPVMEQWIGLALVARGRERTGEIIVAHDPIRGKSADCEIVHHVFYDPHGERQRG